MILERFDNDLFKKIISYFLLGGFTIIIALAWNTAFTNMIQKYFPNKESNVPGQFIYALVLTLIFVIITTFFMDKTTIQKYFNIN